MKITWKIWLLIIVALLSVLAIFSFPPTFLEKGVLVSSVEKNSTIFQDGLREGMTIVAINNKEINSLEDYTSIVSSLPDGKEKVVIQTDESEIINLYTKDQVVDNIVVTEIPSTRLQTGLDLQGGARALVTAENVQLTDSDLNDLIAVSEQRLNVYGLSDVKFGKVTTSSGEKLMSIEIAGSTPGDLESLIAEQGVFEAKIGDDLVFSGGDKDITYVGRTGQDSLITDCFTTSEGEACNFRFVVYLSEKAAQRHADVTENLGVNGSYLDKKIDFYLDGELTSSLNIGVDLKGKVATQIQISGSELGETRKLAIENTEEEMKKLQTVLITGSLPYELEIQKLDKISPRLGEEFTRQILIAGLFAILAVSLLVLVRYRKIKVSIALISVSLSEVLIILGVASLINWNLDLPSLAGIIAAIGTGIDSQIIILDESRDKHESIKQRIKKALFIIMTAFATTFVALIPLTGALSFMGIGAASAGLLKGFAVTTIIGITVGILISRPAFADIVGQMED